MTVRRTMPIKYIVLAMAAMTTAMYPLGAHAESLGERMFGAKRYDELKAMPSLRQHGQSPWRTEFVLADPFIRRLGDVEHIDELAVGENDGPIAIMWYRGLRCSLGVDKRFVLPSKICELPLVRGVYDNLVDDKYRQQLNVCLLNALLEMSKEQWTGAREAFEVIVDGKNEWVYPTSDTIFFIEQIVHDARDGAENRFVFECLSGRSVLWHLAGDMGMVRALVASKRLSPMFAVRDGNLPYGRRLEGLGRARLVKNEQMLSALVQMVVSDIVQIAQSDVGSKLEMWPPEVLSLLRVVHALSGESKVGPDEAIDRLVESIRRNRQEGIVMVSHGKSISVESSEKSEDGEHQGWAQDREMSAARWRARMVLASINSENPSAALAPLILLVDSDSNLGGGLSRRPSFVVQVDGSKWAWYVVDVNESEVPVAVKVEGAVRTVSIPRGARSVLLGLPIRDGRLVDLRIGGSKVDVRRWYE